MWANFLKAVLEWISGLVKSEIKKDVKASDAETEDEIRDRFRASVRDRLRKHPSGVHKK
jgi:hypothetical protein